MELYFETSFCTSCFTYFSRRFDKQQNPLTDSKAYTWGFCDISSARHHESRVQVPRNTAINLPLPQRYLKIFFSLLDVSGLIRRGENILGLYVQQKASERNLERVVARSLSCTTLVGDKSRVPSIAQ